MEEYRNTENREHARTSTSIRIVYYTLGAIEALLAFRLILKILGANPRSIFVSLIYNLSGVFTAPFTGIFRTAVSPGIETQSVLEPATIIAMPVYALLAWGIARLIYINLNKKREMND